MRKHQLTGCIALLVLGSFLVLVETGELAYGQSTGNILNLPGTGPQPTQTPESPGGLPSIDFSTNPKEATQLIAEWKKCSLPEHFNYNPLKQGAIDYPAGWVVNFDAPAQTVTFLEDASGLVGWSLITLRFITTTRAEDYTGMLLQSLQRQVAHLQIVEQ